MSLVITHDQRRQKWAGVDWSLPNIVIARQVGVSGERVRQTRKARGLPASSAAAKRAAPTEIPPPGAAWIPLPHGRLAIVDEADVLRFGAFNWCLRGGYVVRRSRPSEGREVEFVTMHHEVLPPLPGMVIDHVSGNRLDNRRANLRIGTHTQNLWNQRARGGSGFKGVYRDSKSKGWNVVIRIEGKVTYIGFFSDVTEAAKAYDASARAAHGSFARLNYPGPGEQSAINVPLRAAQ
jgi:hypothetical protein